MTGPCLNRKLRLEVPFRTRDDAGGYDTTWAVEGTLWAAVAPGTGSEAEVAGLSISSVPFKITVRASPIGSPARPVAGHRLRDGDRVFRVLAVTEADAMARYLICTAREEEVSS
jgi:head-tail adaptor